MVQNAQPTMSLYERLSQAFHQKAVVLQDLEHKFRNADFTGARSALRDAFTVLYKNFDPKRDGALVQYNLDRAERAILAVVLPKAEPKKAVSEPKVKKPITGRFVGETPALKTTVLNGPNVVPFQTSEMTAALRKQRQLAGLEPPKRGQAIHIVNGHKKRAGKKG